MDEYPIGGRFRLKRSDFSIQFDRFPARHSQIGQRERGLEVLSALRTPTVTHLDVPELPLDHAERVIDPLSEGSA
jgi:hypothetical protein